LQVSAAPAVFYHPLPADAYSEAEQVDVVMFLGCVTSAHGKVVLTRDHPRNVRILAWCHDYRDSRVLCWQSGHDAVEWTDPSFHKIFQQGIEWLARRR
jgi:type 1 glutamine amidotransferase